jgi:hypothetical protein
MDENLFKVQDTTFFSHSSLHATLYLPEVPVYESVPEDIENPVDVVFGDQIRLVGYDIGDTLSTEIGLPVTLYWQTESPTPHHYKYNLRLVESGEDGQVHVLSLTEREPYEGAIPTIYWQPGQTIVEYTELPAVRSSSLPTVPQPDGYQILLQVYRADTQEKLAITQAVGAETSSDGETVSLPFAPELP